MASVIRSTSRSSHSPHVTVIGVLMPRTVEDEDNDEVVVAVLAPVEGV